MTSYNVDYGNGTMVSVSNAVENQHRNKVI